MSVRVETRAAVDQPGREADRTLVIVLRAVVALGGTLAVIGSAMLITAGHAELWWREFLAFAGLLALFFAIVAWLVIPQQPRNAVVWVMAAIAALCGLDVAGRAGVALWAVDDPALILGAPSIPADLSAPAAVTLIVSEWSVVAAILAIPTFGFLLFPDGRLPAPRWRWVGALAAVSILAAAAGAAWSYRPGSMAVDQGALADAGATAAIAATILSLVALVGRFRRSVGVARQQFKWIVWGASVFGPALIAAILLGGESNEGLLVVPLMVAAAVFIASYGIAVGRYRLYDIDVVINKTVVVGTLAIVLSGLYVAVVVGVGSLFGSGDGADFIIQVAATALVAIAFGPMRRRAQEWANRLVYGQRATPYEVLARFSHRAAEASDDELLWRIPRLIVDGTAAAEATIWVHIDEGFHATATWPETAAPEAITGTDTFADPNADYSLPVFHDGELLGGLSLNKARGEELPSAEEQLIASLAGGMGLALRNSRLTAKLREHVAELEASRERILAAADEARRALERDLDSGPQQQLVALKVMLGPTRKLAAQAGAAKTAEILAQLESDAGEAIRAVRAFSGGVYPPLLEAEGLPVAISNQTQRAALRIDVEADGVGRYSREVEAAVYFTILEALQNIAKYAGASTTSVALRETGGQLSFEVTDDGGGFDPATVAAGSGLANMSDRIDAIAGSLSFESAPGSGTTVRGTVPIGDRVGV